MAKPRILVVDDEEIIRELLAKTLTRSGYEVVLAEDGKVAIEKARDTFINIIISDLKMPKVDGMQVLREIKKTNPFVELIIITGYPTIESAVEAIKLGAFEFLCKPFDIKELEGALSRCIDKQKSNFAHVELSELSVFSDIAKAITSTEKFDMLLHKILDSALKLSKAEQGALMLFNEAAGVLEVGVSQGLGQEPVMSLQARCDAVLLESLRIHALPVEVPMGGLGQPGFLAVPLLGKTQDEKNNLMGIMGIVAKNSADGFTDREKSLLGVLAGEGASAIENFKLYLQLQEKIDLLEKTIKELDGTQQQLIQSEKLAAVGQLAFGIAHEIRNPLGIILGGVEFLKSNLLNRDEVISVSIDKITHSITRANNIIIDLLKFSRASNIEMQTANVCAVMDEVASLIGNQAYLNGIQVLKQYGPDPVMLHADPNLLRQAFFNMCVNAIDAMPKGGELTLRIAQGPGKEPGRSDTTVQIGDTGEGIKPDVLNKIFDPFFTTKEPGKGTGLGLSIVHMIFKRHNAMIRVESNPGQGTQFIGTFSEEIPKCLKADTLQCKEEDYAKEKNTHS